MYFVWQLKASSMSPHQRQTAPSPPLAGLQRHLLVLLGKWLHQSLGQMGRVYAKLRVPLMTARIT